MEQRRRRNMRQRRRRKRAILLRILLGSIFVIGIVSGALYMKYFAPTKDRVNVSDYYNIKGKEQVAVIIDETVIGVRGKLFDNQPYLEYSTVRDYLNDRIYVDRNENILLYTLSTGTIRAEVGAKEYTLKTKSVSTEYPLLKMEGDVAYVALSFVQEHTNMECKLYADQGIHRLYIVQDWGKREVATVRKDTCVRERGGNKSKILADVAKNSQVRVLEDLDGWIEVCTEDGYVGYIKESHLKNQRTEELSRAFQEETYTHIKKDYTINLGWHVVNNSVANNNVLSTIADTKGLTAISPTWFTVADTKGNLHSLASSQYVNYAHQSGIEVWALVRDFDGGIQSPEETKELLSSTSHRENLINQLMAEVLQHKIDGINVDFELVYDKECGEHFIQFIRELSVKCRQNEIVLSVDNYSPTGGWEQYHLKEQAKVADYVVLMGYDEHTIGSEESGPVASLSFVEEGIQKALEVVPKEQLINAVPFYTRVWKEVPKKDGTLRITSQAYGMRAAETTIQANGAKAKKDKATGMNYAEWKDGKAVYKVWLEDLEALEEKLEVIQKYELAGVAEWRLGFETTKAWDLIQKYVN